MYKPLKKELLEMGFVRDNTLFYKSYHIGKKLFFYDRSACRDSERWNFCDNEMYPESKQDIEALIRIFKLK